MVIKHKMRAEQQFVNECHHEHQVRRVAGLYDVDAASALDAERKIELAGESDEIFPHEANGRTCFAQGVTVDANVGNDLVGLVVTFALRTNNRNGVPSFLQSQRFLPNPPIEGDRKIFNQDENVTAV